MKENDGKGRKRIPEKDDRRRGGKKMKTNKNKWYGIDIELKLSWRSTSKTLWKSFTRSRGRGLSGQTGRRRPINKVLYQPRRPLPRPHEQTFPPQGMMLKGDGWWEQNQGPFYFALLYSVFVCLVFRFQFRIFVFRVLFSLYDLPLFLCFSLSYALFALSIIHILSTHLSLHFLLPRFFLLLLSISSLAFPFSLSLILHHFASLFYSSSSSSSQHLLPAISSSHFSPPPCQHSFLPPPTFIPQLHSSSPPLFRNIHLH